MSPRKIFLILALSVLSCREAAADFYFEQDVHKTERELDHVNNDGLQVSDFKRKVYVMGQVLAIQIEENGQIQMEVGFDFAKNRYYEADHKAAYYKLFDLGVLARAFEALGRRQEKPPGRYSKRRIADHLSQALLEGKMDTPVRIEKAFFGKKEFNGKPAQLYKLREGPGSSFLNFLGWYRKADLWGTTDVPGFLEYAAIREKLQKKAGFYKIKHNRVSDFITTLSTFEAFPLRMDSVAKRRFERAMTKETTREVTSFINTAKIKPGQLFYFKQAPSFSWNTVFSEGSEFGSEVSLERGENFSLRRSLPWFAIPVLFIVFSYLWFLGGYADMDELSLKRLVMLRVYILISLLLALELTHYIRDLPFLISPLVELMLVVAAGILWIPWEIRAHLRNVDRQMRDSHLRYCPHCHARCEKFYVVCPNCGGHF